MKANRRSARKNEELDRAKQQFENWRLGNKGRRTVIPDELWNAAIHLTHTLPVSVVATHLRLNYTVLKEHAHASYPIHAENQESSPVFVEFQMNSTPARQARQSECVIELETSGGDKMKICMKSDPPFDVHELCRTFFEKR